MLAAAPRLFRADARAKPGLSTGDAIALQCADGDMFYRVGGHPGDMSAGGMTLAPADRGGPGDTAAQLEVVTVGDGWFGLRSSVAGDRFLQARKHGAARLGFHSGNLGVWEQWRVASGAEGLEEPWDVSRPVVLQNRRLPHVRGGRWREMGGVTQMGRVWCLLGACLQASG